MKTRELGDGAEAVGRDTAVDSGVSASQLGQLQCTVVVHTYSDVDREIEVVLLPRDRRTWNATSTALQ